MRIRWENILTPLLIIVLIVLLTRMPALMRRWSEDLGAVYRGEGDPAIGLMALGIICVTVIGIVRLIWGNRH
ncbi:MAG: hypothetical protein JW993_07585 [Sedimentisphaerales bacterium]|nr:hypothetical protein [Sedimentisphaerales bacterium]